MKVDISLNEDVKNATLKMPFFRDVHGLTAAGFREKLSTADTDSERGLILLGWFFAHDMRGIDFDRAAFHEIAERLFYHLMGADLNPFDLPWIEVGALSARDMQRRWRQDACAEVTRRVIEDGISPNAAIQLAVDHGSVKRAENAFYGDDGAVYRSYIQRQKTLADYKDSLEKLEVAAAELRSLIASRKQDQ
jgi:hypothetical protein